MLYVLQNLSNETSLDRFKSVTSKIKEGISFIPKQVVKN